MTATVPIFPLNTVLYPGSMLPLRIFEQRYLEMTRDCLRDSTPFGVCKIKEGVEVGKAALPEALGCTAVIAEWEMPHLGVFHLKVRGQQRFRIRHQTIQPSGLIRAEIDLLEEVPGSPNEESLDLCRRVLEQIVGRLGATYFLAPLAYDDPRWISYRLAEVLPLSLDEKQTLLEARDDHDRLMRLYEHLKSSA